MSLSHINCKPIDLGYELEVVQCTCGYHMGIDATYLEGVGAVEATCPSCGLKLTIPAFE